MTSKTRNGIGDSRSASHRKPAVGREYKPLDGRSKAGRAISRLIRAMMRDLGGESNLSAQKAILARLAARETVLAEHLDVMILRSASGKAARRRLPVALIAERSRLAAALTRHLRMLGLDRIEAEPPSLAAYLAEREQARRDGGEPEADNAANEAPDDRDGGSENTYSINGQDDSEGEQ